MYNMPLKPEIEQKIEETFNSLEGAQRATPGHFFFTRVQARMQQSQTDVWEMMSSFISRPVIGFATIGFIILINAWVIFSMPSATVTTANQEEKAFAEEYNLAVASVYQYDNSNNP